MAADELPFPPADDLYDPHAAEVRARMQASYAAQPAHTPAQVERVSRAVLAAAMHAPGSGARGGRPRWWWGAAAAAVLFMVVSRPWRPEAAQREADSSFVRGASPTIPSGQTNDMRDGTVRFDVTLPSSAHDVALVGDFNGWDTGATPMVRQGSTWTARVPLEPGRHTYAFVVDGQRWVVDPLAPQVPDEGFGPTNAVIVDGEVQP